MVEKKYSLGHDHYGKWYVAGPNARHGCGEFSYHGGYMNPGSRFESEEEGKKAAGLCNLAYQAGYENAQRDIQKSLGIIP